MMSERTDCLSMTPPMSPAMMDLDELPQEEQFSPEKYVRENISLEKLASVSFFCSERLLGSEGLHFHAESYLKSGLLQRLLYRKKGVCPEWNCTTVNLFGYQFLTQTALLENMEKLFLIAKMYVNELQSSTIGSMFDQQEKLKELLQNKQHLNIFLGYVLMFVEQSTVLNIKQHQEFLDQLINNLHGLLLYMGRISDLPVTTILNMCEPGNKLNGILNQQYHVYLDVYSSLIGILFSVGKCYPDYSNRKQLISTENTDVQMTIFDQVVYIILTDLINLAMLRKDKLPEVQRDNGPFTCSCCVELWVIIMFTVQWLHKENNDESLIVRIHRILQKFDDEVTPIGEDEMELDSSLFYTSTEKPKHILNFNFWLIVHVAKIYSVDEVGYLKQIEKTDNHYFVLESFLKKSLAKECLTEINLRYQLRLCLKACQLWEPTTNLIVILWDYFFRRLNNSFKLPSSGVKDLATVSLTPLALLEKCRKHNTSDEGLSQETSNSLFLRILSYNLSRFVQAGSMQEWRQMKGRFYSKFHKRRLQEFSEVGLENFTCLFLTLAVTVELEDVAGKLLDFYNMLEFSSLSLSKRAVVLRGSLALVHVYIERKMDITFMADRLVQYFNILCQEMSELGDPHKHHGIWKLFCLYIDSVQDILESSTSLTSSEYKLLGNGLQGIWTDLSETELRHCMSVFVAVVTRLRAVLKLEKEKDIQLQHGGKINKQHEELAFCLWNTVYPFIKEHACTQTPPPMLADLAASFTLLSNDIPPSVVLKDKFVSHVEYFGLSENVHVSVSCRYLSQVLSEEGAMESLLSVCQQSTLIKAWFRCVLLVPPSSSQLHDITRIVFELNEVKELVSTMGMTTLPSVEVMPQIFIKSLGRLYQDAVNLKDKMLLREKVMSYFSLVPQQIAPVLKAMGPSETLQTMFSTVGYLVKHCAPLLFVQSNPNCPLPAIISSMVTPHFLFSTDKPVNSTFLAVIRDSLHMFIQGLSKLDFRRTPYVERRLKDIVSIYLQKYPVKSSFSTNESAAVHPLISSLSDSYTKTPSLTAVNFRHFILEIIHDKYLSLKNMTVPTTANLGLSFVTEILQRTSSGEVLARDCKVILITILEYVLFSTSQPMKQHAGKIMQFLVEACLKNPVAVPVEEVGALLKRFMNMYSRMYFDGVFNVLETIAALYVDVIISMIPDCTSLVLDLEVKRGVGVDSKLRKTYYSLLNCVGEVGQKEMEKLRAS